MSVKKTKEVVLKIAAKGILKEINDDGFVILDEKDNVEELIKFEDINLLIGKPISFTFQNKEADLAELQRED